MTFRRDIVSAEVEEEDKEETTSTTFKEPVVKNSMC